MERRMIDAGGTRVAVWETGEGLPVLFLHGLSLDHRAVVRIGEEVFADQSGFRRIYLDMPGMGETVSTPELATTSAIVETLDVVVETLVGSQPLALFGQSYGAYVARGILARRPSQVMGLAQLVPVVEPQADRRVTPPPRKLRADDAAMGALPGPFLDELRQFVVVESPGVAAGLANDIVPGVFAGDTAFIDQLQKHGYTLPDDDLHGTFEGPSLVVCGRDDAVVGYEQALELLPLFPRATFAVLDGAGHMAELERRETVLALLRDWVGRLAVG